MKRVWLIFILTALVSFPTAAMADVTPVGLLTFDNPVPDPGGANDFTVYNFTGSSSLPPDFPVTSPVIFDNIVLVATLSDASLMTFNLGDLGPGANSSATFSDSLLVTQVVFTATIDPTTTTFTLAGPPASTLVADSALSLTLLPSSGSSLIAGTDFDVINATGISPTPEPASISLFALGLLLMLGIGARKYLNIVRS